MKDSRQNIINYFQKKNTWLTYILTQEAESPVFPFFNVYEIYRMLEAKGVDTSLIIGYISSAALFNRYKSHTGFKLRESLAPNDRRNQFVTHNLSDKVSLESWIYSIIDCTLVADNVLSRITEDFVFKHFVSKLFTDETGSYYAPEIIIVDYANVYHQLKDYAGENSEIIRLRDEIIGDDSMGRCFNSLVKTISEDLNDDYLFIFVTPTRHQLLSEYAIAVNVDCKPVLNHSCHESEFSKESDDYTVVMLYDYLTFKLGREVSILSGDIYKFSTMFTDYNYRYKRATFSSDDPSNIESYRDLITDYDEIPPEEHVTLFEEDMEDD